MAQLHLPVGQWIASVTADKFVVVHCVVRDNKECMCKFLLVNSHKKLYIGRLNIVFEYSEKFPFIYNQEMGEFCSEN